MTDIREILNIHIGLFPQQTSDVDYSMNQIESLLLLIHKDSNLSINKITSNLRKEAFQLQQILNILKSGEIFDKQKMRKLQKDWEYAAINILALQAILRSLIFADQDPKSRSQAGR